MKNRIKQWVFLLAVLSIGFIFSTPTYAEEGETATSQAAEEASGFTYQVIFPENQISENGYYDLRMTPGQQQTVEILLKNHGKEELTVDVTLSGARTNPNGVVEYGPTKLEADESMKYEFTDIVKGPESVTLAPGAEEAVRLDITMPEASFDGIILGGIQLQRQSDETEAEENQGMMIVNEYAYVVGMVLSENDTEIAPEMSFIKAYASQPNYRNSIVIDLGNVTATPLKGVTVEAQIMGETSDTVLYDAKKLNMNMAPNTVLNFPVSMGSDAMKAGKYRAHVVATMGDKKWEWTEPFEITKEQADKFNREAVGLVQEQGLDWQLIAMIVGGVVAVVVVIFLIIHFTGKSKKKKGKKNRKKKK
ncbi:DUF916 and DUF3324 domain-containing protein [Enterococcus sp. BWM-S5]|uniref:DUF916 and DUF3324 domain-containing protein n=1 Tax=Enterococcus larvae TaxID=2794352 RepID=A0ABS4CLW8_9ENTE|nr:DUF916 and DUF3324 domain-containing protein [Enterococcus larvae]MBP1047586.1 DUF916 and DUF3324 domain-containing protein [Enterococcus larvae]